MPWANVSYFMGGILIGTWHSVSLLMVLSPPHGDQILYTAVSIVLINPPPSVS